ncbi:MAG TPA: sarcosine oxidase subunit gamma family protein [Anaerolineales bacterium]|nr:sarcosine oxidase subunit gamma family protein [Anaerolineales bacterium]
MKRSPLYSTFQSLTTQFTDQNGWQVPDSISTLDVELTALRERVALTDLSASGKITVEGQQAGTVIQTIFNVDAPSLAINAGMATGPFGVYCLRKDLFFIHTTPGQEELILETLEQTIRVHPPSSASDFVTVTDITHGRAEIGVFGPSGPELLSRLCGLDFHDSQFPSLTAKQSSVAKTPQIITRHDLAGIRAYALIGDRSFGVYLWETAMKAGQDLGIAAVGMKALQALAQ